jgi:putative PIN family toxin of toxin-antitoxin system
VLFVSFVVKKIGNHEEHEGHEEWDSGFPFDQSDRPAAGGGADMKVVLDANVIIAAFAARGLCEALLELCLSDHEIIVSRHLLAEVQRHLIGKIMLPVEVAKEIVTLLENRGILVEPVAVDQSVCRDQGDLPILGLAVAAGADYIVSGDKDLLVLKHHGNIPICSPREFAEALRH